MGPFSQQQQLLAVFSFLQKTDFSQNQPHQAPSVPPPSQEFSHLCGSGPAGPPDPNTLPASQLVTPSRICCSFKGPGHSQVSRQAFSKCVCNSVPFIQLWTAISNPCLCFPDLTEAAHISMCIRLIGELAKMQMPRAHYQRFQSEGLGLGAEATLLTFTS